MINNEKLSHQIRQDNTADWPKYLHQASETTIAPTALTEIPPNIKLIHIIANTDMRVNIWSISAILVHLKDAPVSSNFVFHLDLETWKLCPRMLLKGLNLSFIKGPVSKKYFPCPLLSLPHIFNLPIKFDFNRTIEHKLKPINNIRQNNKIPIIGIDWQPEDDHQPAPFLGYQTWLDFIKSHEAHHLLLSGKKHLENHQKSYFHLFKKIYMTDVISSDEAIIQKINFIIHCDLVLTSDNLTAQLAIIMQIECWVIIAQPILPWWVNIMTADQQNLRMKIFHMPKENKETRGILLDRLYQTFNLWWPQRCELRRVEIEKSDVDQDKPLATRRFLQGIKLIDIEENERAIDKFSQSLLLTQQDNRKDQYPELFANINNDILPWQARAVYLSNDVDRALELYDHLRTLDLNHSFNYGLCAMRMGRYEIALKALSDYATNLNADAHHEKIMVDEIIGRIYLLTGNFVKGYPLHEKRLFIDNIYGEKPHWKTEQWDGNPLNQGQGLLIYREQGIGDEICYFQLLKFVVPLVKNITLSVDHRLLALFNRSLAMLFPDHEKKPVSIVSHMSIMKQKPAGITHQSSIGSLPYLLNIFINKKPIGEPFILPNNKLSDNIKQNINKINSSYIYIGISNYTKNEYNAHDRNIPIEQYQVIFNALRDFPIRYVNLQYGFSAKTIDDYLKQNHLPILAYNDLNPLIDPDGFAALVSSLDLVITIDNATAHLAGALGVKTLNLLALNQSWRWLTTKKTTDWYKSMILIRQKRYNYWEDALTEAAKEAHCFITQTIAKIKP